MRNLSLETNSNDGDQKIKTFRMADGGADIRKGVRRR
jgi:hypothetical protein